MKKISLLAMALCIAAISVMAQTKPACKKLMDVVNNSKFEVTGDDGATAKNIKLSFTGCKLVYSFDMVAGDEGGSMEITFSLEDVISIEKIKGENIIKLSLYDTKDAVTKLKADGETMEDKTLDVPFALPADRLVEIKNLLRAAVKECNEAFLDIDFDLD